MYTSTFTFAKGTFDDAFFALDADIAQIARSIPGYLGEESWENPEKGLVANLLYLAESEYPKADPARPYLSISTWVQ